MSCTVYRNACFLSTDSHGVCAKLTACEQILLWCLGTSVKSRNAALNEGKQIKIRPEVHRTVHTPCIYVRSVQTYPAFDLKFLIPSFLCNTSLFDNCDLRTTMYKVSITQMNKSNKSAYIISTFIT